MVKFLIVVCLIIFSCSRVQSSEDEKQFTNANLINALADLIYKDFQELYGSTIRSRQVYIICDKYNLANAMTVDGAKLRDYVIAKAIHYGRNTGEIGNIIHLQRIVSDKLTTYSTGYQEGFAVGNKKDGSVCKDLTVQFDRFLENKVDADRKVDELIKFYKIEVQKVNSEVDTYIKRFNEQVQK
jgi:hypothetical protein